MNEPAPLPRSTARVMTALLVSFFLSGGAALIYQVLWTRRLGLVFGVTIQAASTVLACFMAGLAIGSYVAGRRADRLANPIRAFAWIELAIGLCALATPAGLSAAESLLHTLTPVLSQYPAATTATRVLLSAAVLIVPAALMGSTYPLVLQAVARTSLGLRTAAPLLYGINTGGAVAGVFIGSLWLIPTIGMRRSFLVAALLNGIVAVLAFQVSRHLRGDRSIAPASMNPRATSAERLPAHARAAVLIVIALSGTVSLALEIVWFRVLVFFLRPTTYAFASMLATVLIGLTAGSLLATPLLERRANWLVVLAVVEIVIGLSGLISAFLMVRSYGVMEWMWTWSWMPAPYDFVLPLVASAAVAIVPTSILLGAAFPLGLLLWTETGSAADQALVGRRVGVLYALNVTGAILGSLVAGFVLIPHLGSQTSLVLVTAVPLAGGVVLLWMSNVRWSGPAMAGSLVAFAALAATLPDVFHDVIVRRYEGYQVLWHKEDAQAAVSVVSQGRTRSLLIDGMHHANDSDGMVIGHETIGAMGLAVHPDPRHILVVGFGGGATTGSASVLPGTTVQVVELSPSVIEAGRFFQHSNRGAIGNPRVEFLVDDGRSFLKTTSRRFDIITADMLLPEMAGAANLYSSDYFEIARRALAPGGLMVQWIDATDEYRYQLILRSFASVFPHLAIWRDGSIVIGSNEPIRLNRESFERKLHDPETREIFEAVGLGTFENLVAHYVGGRDQAVAYVGDGPLLRDDRPVIEYFISLPRAGRPADAEQMRAPPE